jgi:hypothetical protein
MLEKCAFVGENNETVLLCVLEMGLHWAVG